MSKLDDADETKPVSLAELKLRISEPKSANCEHHGDFESRNIFGGVWSNCPVCSAERKVADDREQAERGEVERQRIWLHHMGEAGIPERFRARTLANYNATNAGQKRALMFATEYAEQFALVCETGRSAIFCGLPGTGKTHLAIGIALHVMGLRKSAMFTTVQRMIRRAKDAWRKDSTESESNVIDMLVYPNLLIIDEIGVQFGSEFEKNFMFDLLNERYEKRRPTILLSNLTATEIKTFLGDRIYDRLREDGGQCVSFDWASHRGKE
ncbi:MAG: ATP-binding protein [Candidatus Brocadiaceae bacterium]|nr:ATP-binding protein [Candidatus Brocadiaceae bacterium]